MQFCGERNSYAEPPESIRQIVGRVPLHRHIPPTVVRGSGWNLTMLRMAGELYTSSNLLNNHLDNLLLQNHLLNRLLHNLPRLIRSRLDLVKQFNSKLFRLLHIVNRSLNRNQTQIEFERSMSVLVNQCGLNDINRLPTVFPASSPHNRVGLKWIRILTFNWAKKRDPDSSGRAMRLKAGEQQTLVVYPKQTCQSKLKKTKLVKAILSRCLSFERIQLLSCSPGPHCWWGSRVFNKYFY